MSISSPLSRLLLVSLLSPDYSPRWPTPNAAKRLRIGITLHPYYSYVANIVGDKADVVPLIPAGSTHTPTSPAPKTSSASAPWT